jgi:Bacterial low temperature requirement A protein (LtrA)
MNAKSAATAAASSTGQEEEEVAGAAEAPATGNCNSTIASVSSTGPVNRKSRKAAGASSSSSSSMLLLTDEQQIQQLKKQILEEKAGKRKLFHSLVKLANELKRIKQESVPLVEQQSYDNRNWYDGGMWRAPEVLPGVTARMQQQHRTTQQQRDIVNTAKTRQAISLSDLFFNLVIVTAFTRVGVAISQTSFIDVSRLLYFAVFWQVWSKEASYSTRFDTTDLSAQMVTLVSCFAVLFASLSVQASIDTVDGTRVMYMAAFVAALYAWLHVRVLLSMMGKNNSTTTTTSDNKNSGTTTAPTSPAATTTTTTPPLYRHIQNYAIFNIIMNLLETSVWCIGIFVFEETWPFRWIIFLMGVILALRVPRAFLANDFHGTSCTCVQVTTTIITATIHE